MATDGARPAVILGPVDTTGDGVTDAIGVDTTGDGRADARGYDTSGDGLIDALDTNGDGEIDADLEMREDGVAFAVPRRNTVVPRFLSSKGRVSSFRGGSVADLIQSEREAAALVALQDLRAVVHADEALHRRLEQRGPAGLVAGRRHADEAHRGGEHRLGLREVLLGAERE